MVAAIPTRVSQTKAAASGQLAKQVARTPLPLSSPQGQTQGCTIHISNQLPMPSVLRLASPLSSSSASRFSSLFVFLLLSSDPTYYQSIPQRDILSYACAPDTVDDVEVKGSQRSWSLALKERCLPNYYFESQEEVKRIHCVSDCVSVERRKECDDDDDDDGDGALAYVGDEDRRRRQR